MMMMIMMTLTYKDIWWKLIQSARPTCSDLAPSFLIMLSKFIISFILLLFNIQTCPRAGTGGIK